MAQLRQDYKEFLLRDTEVLIVLPDDAQEVADFWRKEDMPMPGLVDPGHEAANAYGQQVKLLQFGRMPAMAVVDRIGAVRFEHRGGTMMDIPSNEMVLRLVDELNREWEAQTTVEQAKG